MRKKSAYFVGIKGVAMTALAIYLKEKGYTVTGSDVADHFATDTILEGARIRIKEGFHSHHIDKLYDLVIVTGAHGGMTNIEAVTARQRGLPTLMHGEALGRFMDEKKGISIAGCHGKTTTSSIIASLLIHAGYDPSYAVGTASIADLGNPGHFGTGDYFVAEADEYMTCPLTNPKPRFLWQHPNIIVLTNIEFDHPDAFKDINSVYEAFLSFTKNLSADGYIVACIDDKNVRTLLSGIRNKVITYGCSEAADYRVTRYVPSKAMSFFRISQGRFDLGDFTLSIPGRHNAVNATAAAVVAAQLGVSVEKIRNSLKLFHGSKRRFEKITTYGNLILYDDYAHHPSEIQATIKAAAEWYFQKRVIVIFQPHTFSRTKSLLYEFAKSFRESSTALICDIYPSARERFDTTISSRDLVVQANQVKNNVVYTPDKKSVLKWLEKSLRGDELIITMGAGDIFLWHKDIIEVFKHI